MWGPRASGAGAGARAARGTEDLLAAVAVGDHAAFEALYDTTVNAIYGLVRRILRDPAQSEEVTQEVLLEVWRSAPSYDPSRGHAMTWVMTIAHRRAVDRVRSAQAATDRDLRDAQRSTIRPYDVVGETVLGRLERDEVRAALTSLTDAQRQAVELAYFGGYTHVEVSGLLGVPLGTVKTRIRDGLIRLRDALGVTG